MLDGYADGVWFVDLRGVDADGVAPLIASTLGVVTSGDTPVADQLVDALAGRRLLLVLDNCEHVLDGVAPFVERLTGRDGQIRVLATSREPLGVAGEPMMAVHPLPLPESAGFEQVAVSDAVVLFTERADSAQPGFVLEEHVDAVFEICRVVDGLPLALELAAARQVVFSPEELAVRLDDQLATLRSSQRAGDLRHATIETTIAWSWELLDDAERALLGRLSVFHGTWSLDAAEIICAFGPINRSQVVDLVGSLVAKSLVVVDGVSAGSTRYRLLEPIRQYAARELDGSATERLRTRFIDYWSATLAASYDTSGRVVLRNHEPAMNLEVDQADVTAAVEWALAAGRFEDAMAILASPFGDLLMLQGLAIEPVSRWTDLALEHRESISPGTLLWALDVAGGIACSVSDNETWLGYATLGIENARSTEERHRFELTAAIATNFLEGHTAGTDAMFDRVIDQTEDPGMQASALLGKAKLGPPTQAWALVEQAMGLAPIEAFVWWDKVAVFTRILDSAGDSGHYDIATQMAERALELSRRSGWVMVETQSAAALSWLYAARGRLDEAATLIAEVVPVARRILGPTLSRPLVPWRAASVARQQGRFDEARSYAEESLREAEQTEIGVWGEATALGAIRESALIARDEGDLDQAQDILGDALQRLEDFDHANLGPWICSELLTTRASVALRRNDPHGAREDLRGVLAKPEQLSHAVALVAVDLTAIALAQQGKAKQAARLLGAVDQERERTGLVIRPPDVLLREAAVLQTQSILGDARAAAVEEGREMTFEEAIEYAADQIDAGTETADVRASVAGTSLT